MLNRNTQLKPSNRQAAQRARQNRPKFLQRKFYVIVGLFAVVGSYMVFSTFADTTSTAAKCTPATTTKNSQPVSSTSLSNIDGTCKPIGSSGGLTYWMDKTIPNKRVHVLRIDLTNKRLMIRASQYSERGKKPTEFAQVSGSIAAINGDFFFGSQGYTVNGLAVGNGGQWPNSKDKTTSSFVACKVTNDCFLDVSGTAVTLNPSQYTQVVGGSNILLTPTFQWSLKPTDAGCAGDYTCSYLHPRTAVALSADRKVMWWIMAEGRHSGYSAPNLAEFAALIKRLGASYAINLDGGSSAGMVINGKLANIRPADDANEIRVGNSLGVVELPAQSSK